MPAQAVVPPMIGQTLSHYRILEKLGAGGMGEVYRAHDEQLDREVALKILPSGALADEAARKRFRKEALTLAKLSHPHIGVVHEFGTQDGVDFLVMEYIPGTTLSLRLAAGSLPEKEIVRLGEQIAAALEEAHEQAVIHRDLKPANIMVTLKGQAKVLDFGIAKLVRPAGEMTTADTLSETQTMAGTLPYMAPEQLGGESANARTDIYAAGVVLYEMATGERPFREALFSRLIDSILHKSPVAPRAVNPRISLELERIILKCLEKDPENRYQSAKELAIDLRRLALPSAPVVVPRPRWLRRHWVGALPLLAAAGLLVVLLTLNVGELWERLLRAIAPRGIQSIAVLPLANLSGDSEQDYFADGMTEALIMDLSKIRALRVISRTSVMQYKGTNKPAPQIASELKVDGIVEGSVQLAGGRVKITAQLVDAPSDRHVWAQSYERDLRDVLALESEVARAIVEEIRIQVTPQEHARLAAARQAEPGAHEAYLKGLTLSKGTGEQRRKARVYFEQAVRIDPNYAPAYAGLATSYWATLDMRAQEAMPKAKEYARKALAIDNTQARAHTALASVLFYGDWNWTEAEKEFRRALELDPGDAETHRIFSVFLLAMGRFDEALAQIRTAQESDPLSVVTSTAAGWAYYSARQYDRGAEQCRKALELAPNFDGAHACLSYCYLGSGMYEQAITESKKAFNLSGGDAVRAVWLGRAYALAGKEKEARKMLNELLQRSKRSYVPPYFLATLYMALKDGDQAFSWLEKAYTERDLYLAWLKVDSAFDSVRSDPRFQDLLRRMGLSP
jgi:eukaryotic-like serine/threonine-protein kinase